MKLEFCVLVLSLLTFNNVYGDETQDTNTVVVPLETDEDPANRQTVYTVIGEIGDDIGEIGEEIYKDVQEKIASVPTPDVDFESVYNSVPDVNLESVYDSVPDVDLYAAYKTVYDIVTSIDLEPITRMATKSATNFIAIAPSIAIVGFVGVGLYLMTSLALRVCNKLDL